MSGNLDTRLVFDSFQRFIRDVFYRVCYGYFSLLGRVLEGVPVGFSDLFGVRSDGKAFFIEVKTPKGKPLQAQMNFLQAMKHNGAVAGICRSVQDALHLIAVG